MEFCKTCGEALNEEGLCPACYERMVKIMEQERTDDQTSPTQPKPLDISEEETLPVQPPVPIEHKAQNSLGGECKKQNALGGEHKAQNSLGDKPKLSKSKKTFFLSLGAVLVVLICAFLIGIAVSKNKPAAEELPQEPLPEFIAEEYDEIGTCGEDIRWGFREENGELIIIGTGPMTDYSDSTTQGNGVAPWRLLGVQSVKIYGVSHIGNRAFEDCYLSSLEISNTVKSIGERAFAGAGLTELTLPDGVEVLGDYSFGWNHELASVTIPAKVKSLGEGVFCSCSALSEIRVAEGSEHFKMIDNVLFTKDGKKLLQYPARLRQNSYTVPKGVETIGTGAFWGCSILQYITLPNSVRIIETSGFRSCEKLDTIVLPGVEIIGDYAFDGCSALRMVNFGNKLKKIGLCGFYGCRSLRDVTLPETLETIGKSAFFLCSYLYNLTIPAATTDISEGAFTYSGLMRIDVDENNQAYKSVDGVLFTKDGTVLVAYPGGKRDSSYRIPDGVQKIAYGAFDKCANVTKVTIPADVSTIGKYAFHMCSVQDLYYEGSSSQWNGITIEEDSGVESMKLHFKG